MSRLHSDATAERGAVLQSLMPPATDDPERVESARTFLQVALITAAIATTLLLAIGASQPELWGRSLRSLLIVDGMVVVTLVINRLGHSRAAAWIYLCVIIGLLSLNAMSAGGIRSPGIQAWFIFVMLAGLLLGYRAGVGVALACVLMGLGLVIAEQRGFIANQGIDYDPITRWLLGSLFIGIALLTLRAATTRVEGALRRARSELRDRREAEQRLARSLEAGRIGTFDWDLQTDRFLSDERAQQITGLRAGPDGRVALAEWLDCVHPDDRAAVSARLEVLRSDGAGARLNYRSRVPTGELRHIEVAASTTMDDVGRPRSVLGMIMDVTERQRATQEREQLVQNLGERVKELRLLHDFAGLLQRARGLDRPLIAELAHRIPAAWMHAEDACARVTYRDTAATSPEYLETQWKQAASFTTSGGVGSIEVCYRRAHPSRDEGPFLAEERALIDSLAELLRTHGEQWETERQRRGLEAQLRQAQRLDALGTLAGGIAHDFNNILTAIGGHAELALLDQAEGKVATESIQEILRAHDRARDLVRRILLFSRREEAVTREIIALPAVVDEAVKLLRASLPSNVQIHVEVAPQLPDVLADGTQIHQVVMNLGTNAGYAMKGRGGTLRIVMDTITVVDEASAPSADLAPGLHVRLRVRDSGTGMSAEVMDRLFEPFFTTKGLAGTGLGLSVVHGVIRDHEGAITVTSEVGAGTEFFVYLPARRGLVQREARAEVLLRGSGQHIMYVDDEPSLTMVMSRTLRHMGYRCTEFTDADAAIQEFRTTPDAFDAVITDLQMPSMTGLELITVLRTVRPDLPAAIASGYHSMRDAGAQTAGLAWLSKPASLAEISALVHGLTH